MRENGRVSEEKDEQRTGYRRSGKRWGKGLIKQLFKERALLKIFYPESSPPKVTLNI
jgi:hypothetical protein